MVPDRPLPHVGMARSMEELQSYFDRAPLPMEPGPIRRWLGNRGAAKVNLL